MGTTYTYDVLKYRKNVVNEKNITFLTVFYDWLKCWNSISGRNGKSTYETDTALYHTTNAIDNDEACLARKRNAVYTVCVY